MRHLKLVVRRERKHRAGKRPRAVREDVVER